MRDVSRGLRDRSPWISAAVLLALCVFLQGCSTPRALSSGRMGFFDALASRGSPRKLERYPAVEKDSVVERSPDRSNEYATIESTDDPKIKKVRHLVQGWRWPLEHVKVTSDFGERGSSFHEGVDLAAPVGTPVYATESGKIVFAGSRIRGYGKMLVMKHAGSGLLSVYAHLSQYKVKTGQNVKKGQKIALSGKTGRVSGPHLHFEIRRGVVSYDPRYLLAPTRKALQVASRYP